MREDLIHLAVGVVATAIVIAVGLLLGWSDGGIGTAVLAAAGVALFAGDALSRRFSAPRKPVARDRGVAAGA